MCESTTIASTGSFIYAVLDNLIQTIFQHLSATDLCHVASCCRWLRDATNQDSLWRHLCQGKGWEHYGTTTDLAKIPSYGPSEQAAGNSVAGDDIVTFQKDRIVTDDNTAGLTGTCRWKGVYMRAYHLDRNWVTNCSHFKESYIGLGKKTHRKRFHFHVDGDLLAFHDVNGAIQVYDIRKKAFQCVIPSMKYAGGINFKNGVIVISMSYHGNGVAHAFDAKTGKLLQKINGNWGGSRVSLFFDGELVITCAHTGMRENIYVWCVKDGQLQRILTMDPSSDGVRVRDIDYRDKMVAAVYDDDYIRVWNARSGECLHKLECPGEKSRVTLGESVIVGLSKKDGMAVFDISIWSRDTGACQKVIREIPWPMSFYPNADVVNNFILSRGMTDSAPDHQCSSLYVYNLRGELVTEMANHIHGMSRNGRNRVFLVDNEPFQGEVKTWKEITFNVTPNSFVRLFDVGCSEISWIDDIRMIIYDRMERRFLFHHYW
ncbi:F-box/WD repeat-containing protein 7-like [Patiria miniata]|uniref:F-box domain-containing protein n=1 Tax=Patiria miniata TaxID=46514 RepID=A0A914AM08_PATMI|nr:F-box/WD repeat-containing protein 7-like [Patiria miniata]